MTEGFHAADDGSLARSTGGAAARGAMLIALAIVIGLVLLMFALDDPETEVAAVVDDTEEVEGDDEAVEGGVTVGEASDVDDTATEAADGAGGDADAGAETESIPEEPLETNVARPPSEVNVLVANAVGIAGIAGATADVLIADGYIGVAGDAPNGPTSVILYKEGFDADAIAVAGLLGAGPDIVQPVSPDGSIPVNQNAQTQAAAANVIVIIGSDGAIQTP